MSAIQMINSILRELESIITCNRNIAKMSITISRTAGGQAAEFNYCKIILDDLPPFERGQSDGSSSNRFIGADSLIKALGQHLKDIADSIDSEESNVARKIADKRKKLASLNCHPLQDLANQSE